MFGHTGKPLSFVYDVADIYQFETVVPLAFKIAAKRPGNPEQQVRRVPHMRGDEPHFNFQKYF